MVLADRNSRRLIGIQMANLEVEVGVEGIKIIRIIEILDFKKPTLRMIDVIIGDAKMISEQTMIVDWNQN